MKKHQKRLQGAAVELWGAKVALSTIRNQLKVFERTLRRVPVFTKANALNHIKSRKPMSGRLRKISMSTKFQKVITFRRGEWPDSSISIYSMYTNQNINFSNCFIDLLI
jgi:hypothetical protein